MARLRRVEPVMGLPVAFDLRDCSLSHATAIERAIAWLHEVDRRFSPFRTDSEVSRLDRGELPAGLLSEDLAHVLDVCARYERRSGGAFRARLPGRGLDPCAVVKGWAVQRAADLLEAAGVRNFCVNAGGDVVVRGEPAPGAAWRVGVRHPDHSDQLCAVLSVRRGAVATSAAYERGAHILDGRTGLPARGLLSVTVLADDLTVADSTATAAFALGAEGIGWAATEPGCQVFAIDADGVTHRSPGLPI